VAASKPITARICEVFAKYRDFYDSEVLEKNSPFGLCARA
jgi:hypothetical protein